MNTKRHLKIAWITSMLAVSGMASSSAAITVLTFEGLGDFESVSNYYNGGFGGNGSGPGTNYGVTFSDSALALIDSDAGGSGYIGGEPSPSTGLFFVGDTAIMTYATGFTTGFSFYYTAINFPGVVKVYDGLDGTGNLLASIVLPKTISDGGDPTGAFSPFFAIGVNFNGIARSVDFGGTANQIVFDNITFGSSSPVSSIPEPGNVIPLGCLLVSGLAFRNRRGLRRRGAQEPKS